MHVRCTGQDNGCCTRGSPCSVGEGDCDLDKECAGTLRCGNNNCAWGGDDDCCMGITFDSLLSFIFPLSLRESIALRSRDVSTYHHR